MEVGKRYIVTKASDDGTLEVGDHVSLNSDGSITCREAQGWIEACDVEAATKGAVIEVDNEWVKQRKNKLIAELKTLTA